MVTVAGVGFSITIVALVLASTQFGPRLLGLFMRDIISQATLGTFIGTFTYCVLVLRTIRGPDEVGGAFVPQVAMTIAIGITLVSVGVLVYFFHHVAVTIQAPNVVSTVAHDLHAAIDHLRKPGHRRRRARRPPPTRCPIPGSSRVGAPGAAVTSRSSTTRRSCRSPLGMTCASA